MSKKEGPTEKNKKKNKKREEECGWVYLKGKPKAEKRRMVNPKPNKISGPDSAPAGVKIQIVASFASRADGPKDPEKKRNEVNRWLAKCWGPGILSGCKDKKMKNSVGGRSLMCSLFAL